MNDNSLIYFALTGAIVVAMAVSFHFWPRLRVVAWWIAFALALFVAFSQPVTSAIQIVGLLLVRKWL